LQLANPDQRTQANQVVTELLGDSVLPNTDPTALSVKVSDAAAAAQVLNALSEASIRLTDFALSAPSLDDVFFTLTGHAAERSATNGEGGQS
jgi:hypothetical protein